MLDDEGNELAVPAEKSIYEDDGSVLITLTCTGDFTIGGDSRKRADIFNDELKRQGGDINFTMRNMRDTLLADDLTLVNFEGTLTDSTYVPANKKNNQFLFSAPPGYVSMLTDNGVEAVSLENNHVMDHGEEGLSGHLADAGERGHRLEPLHKLRPRRRGGGEGRGDRDAQLPVHRPL